MPDYGCECHLLLQEAGKGVLKQEFLVMGVAGNAFCTLMPHERELGAVWGSGQLWAGFFEEDKVHHYPDIRGS